MDTVNLGAVQSLVLLPTPFEMSNQRSFLVRRLLVTNGFEHVHLRRLALNDTATGLFSPLNAHPANGFNCKLFSFGS